MESGFRTVDLKNITGPSINDIVKKYPDIIGENTQERRISLPKNFKLCAFTAAQLRLPDDITNIASELLGRRLKPEDINGREMIEKQVRYLIAQIHKNGLTGEIYRVYNPYEKPAHEIERAAAQFDLQATFSNGAQIKKPDHGPLNKVFAIIVAPGYDELKNGETMKQTEMFPGLFLPVRDLSLPTTDPQVSRISSFLNIVRQMVVTNYGSDKVHASFESFRVNYLAAQQTPW